MKTAIGTKVIRFESMTKAQFAEVFGRKHPDNSPEDAEGYHVQYDNPDGSTYDSWSPKDVFEAAYTDIEGDLDFGHAYFMMKQGKKCKPDSRIDGFYVFMRDGWVYTNSGERYYCDDEDLSACWSIVNA